MPQKILQHVYEYTNKCDIIEKLRVFYIVLEHFLRLNVRSENIAPS